jgi:hypothetical protein
VKAKRSPALKLALAVTVALVALTFGAGAATPWNPNANSTVDALGVGDSAVYAGGYFTTIGGQARKRLAAVHAITGLATAWNPDPNNVAVYVLAVRGNVVYAGGDFTSIGGQPRTRIAALDAATGLQLKRLSGHTTTVIRGAFNPAGTLMATLQGAKVFEHQYYTFGILLGASGLVILISALRTEFHTLIKSGRSLQLLIHLRTSHR